MTYTLLLLLWWLISGRIIEIEMRDFDTCDRYERYFKAHETELLITRCKPETKT